MSDEHFAALSAQAKAVGLPGIASLLLKKSGVLNDEAEAADIVKKAIKLAKRKKPREQFRLKELFQAHDWEQFSKGARLRAGRQFFAIVLEAGRDLGIAATEKTSSNHQAYVRLLHPL
jgi:hypothetical protein